MIDGFIALYIFMLAAFTGYEIIGKVPAILHTPLMSGSPAVIVDLAAETGGNCELTRAGETVEHDGVRIVGPVNLAADLANHASEMYARNLFNFLSPAISDGELGIDWEDEVFAGALLTRDGEVIHGPSREQLADR